MTVQQYIQQQLEIFGVEISECFLVAEINALGISESLVVDVSTRQQTKEIIYSMIPTLLLKPSAVSEGGYSISYDKEALSRYYGLLAKELGKPDLLNEKATITDITDQW